MPQNRYIEVTHPLPDGYAIHTCKLQGFAHHPPAEGYNYVDPNGKAVPPRDVPEKVQQAGRRVVARVMPDFGTKWAKGSGT